MFRNSVRLFSLMGFEVRLDPSWVFLAALLTWSLAVGFFPARVPDLQAWAYWALGAAGAVGIFASIIFHEFCHSLVARSRGMRMHGITLFIFGGVAELGEEPPDAATEFWVAVVGPISSIALGFSLIVLLSYAAAQGAPEPLLALLGYLGVVNVILAIFNLLPGFPLDGGRILRAVLWRWQGDLTRATLWAAACGRGFGMLLIGLGMLATVGGRYIGGLWWVVLGLFLMGAARAAYGNVLLRKHLSGETVRRFMRELDGHALEAPSVADAVSPDEDVLDALRRMQRAGRGVLLVAEGGRLLGVVRMSDLLRYWEAKQRVEERTEAPRAR